MFVDSNLGAKVRFMALSDLRDLNFKAVMKRGKMKDELEFIRLQGHMRNNRDGEICYSEHVSKTE